MDETAKFVGNNASAYLKYTADLESGIFIIENLDEVGFKFLDNIDVGQKISIEKRNASINLLVTKLILKGQHIQCQAVVVS